MEWMEWIPRTRPVTWEHVHNTHALLAKEISDLNFGASVLDVSIDGEMCVHQPHLVQKALGDPGDHVLNMGCGGSDGRQVFSLAKMAVHPDLFDSLFLEQVQVHRQVFEVPLQLSYNAEISST